MVEFEDRRAALASGTDAIVGGTGIDVDDRRTGTRNGVEATEKTVAFVAADDDDADGDWLGSEPRIASDVSRGRTERFDEPLPKARCKVEEFSVAEGSVPDEAGEIGDEALPGSCPRTGLA